MPVVSNAYRGCRIRPAHLASVPEEGPDLIKRPTDGKGLKLYLWLFDVAKAGDVCPSNLTIAERFAFESPASSSRLLIALEHMGLIEVERRASSRRVFVRELQRWTA
jgi:hypothetical protein